MTEQDREEARNYLKQVVDDFKRVLANGGNTIVSHYNTTPIKYGLIRLYVERTLSYQLGRPIIWIVAKPTDQYPDGTTEVTYSNDVFDTAGGMYL